MGVSPAELFEEGVVKEAHNVEADAPGDGDRDKHRADNRPCLTLLRCHIEASPTLSCAPSKRV